MTSLNITIPVLNEERRVTSGVSRLVEFLDESGEQNYEVVIADNGSTDGTAAASQALISAHPQVKYIRLPAPGVGRALRTAWSQSRCDIVGCMDVDLATSLHHVTEALDIIRSGRADFVNGSRYLKGAHVENRTLVRTLTSRSFNLMLRAMFRAGFTDGMCGFQFLRRDAFVALEKAGIECDGWYFSTEIMVKAHWLGIPLAEIPVQWNDGRDSRVKIVSLSARYLRESLNLKRQERSFKSRVQAVQ